jgi:hypothetical protein
MLAVSPQEGTGAALAAVGGGDHALRQQPGEGILGQVLVIVGVVILATDEDVDRVPVGPAERGRRGCNVP